MPYVQLIEVRDGKATGIQNVWLAGVPRPKELLVVGEHLRSNSYVVEAITYIGVTGPDQATLESPAIALRVSLNTELDQRPDAQVIPLQPSFGKMSEDEDPSAQS